VAAKSAALRPEKRDREREVCNKKNACDTDTVYRIVGRYVALLCECVVVTLKRRLQRMLSILLLTKTMASPFRCDVCI
jgi:hypothetical protein